MKELIKKWLDKLAAANEESFGTGRMDCCELNRQTTSVQKSNKISKSK